jgi:hypothetical protein
LSGQIGALDAIAFVDFPNLVSRKQFDNERSYFFFFDLHVAAGHVPPGV